MTLPHPAPRTGSSRRVRPARSRERKRDRILVTGATGYIGGLLLPLLERTGRPVRCLVRQRGSLRDGRARATEVVRGDVLDPHSLAPALEDVHTAYYLIHSMGGSGGFEAQDREAASNFARAARAAGVRRIIYLGGLGAGPGLSEHLASRQDVGRILRESGVPTVEFRASIILGAGSLSFRMIRSLVERLPILLLPRWVQTRAQPIAVDDVLAYLMQALERGVSGIYEIGGADRVSYLDLMREYARQRGLRRLLVRVPVLTPWLSSLWLSVVTPLYARVGRKLIEGVRNETIVHDDRARREFDIRPLGVRAAVARALA